MYSTEHSSDFTDSYGSFFLPFNLSHSSIIHDHLYSASSYLKKNTQKYKEKDKFLKSHKNGNYCTSFPKRASNASITCLHFVFVLFSPFFQLEFCILNSSFHHCVCVHNNNQTVSAGSTFAERLDADLVDALLFGKSGGGESERGRSVNADYSSTWRYRPPIPSFVRKSKTKLKDFGSDDLSSSSGSIDDDDQDLLGSYGWHNSHSSYGGGSYDDGYGGKSKTSWWVYFSFLFSRGLLKKEFYYWFID